MNLRRMLALVLAIIAIAILVTIPILFFTPLHALPTTRKSPHLDPPPTHYTYIPHPNYRLILVPKGTPNRLQATSAILIDDDTGNILYDLNGEHEQAMASTTKIMTALIAIQIGNLNQMVPIGQDAINEVQENNGSSAYLTVGEKIRLQDLLYGIMLPSGNDAAVAIADAIAGNPHNFVKMMNLEAQRLHLFQTLYANPDGLEITDNQGNIVNGAHYTTSYDLARLTRYALHIPLFAKIVRTSEYDLPATSTHNAHHWSNLNNLLKNYPGTIGVKTGATDQAGECLVFAVKRNGHTLIGVVLHSTISDETARFTDAKTLLNWGFSLPLQRVIA